jgi:hypothetical protein
MRTSAVVTTTGCIVQSIMNIIRFMHQYDVHTLLFTLAKAKNCSYPTAYSNDSTVTVSPTQRGLAQRQ